MINRRFAALFGLAFIFVCTFSFVHPWSSQARSTPTTPPLVRVQYRYYPISGNTASDLRSQMNRSGPRDRVEGRTYDANTDWVVRWSYRYAMHHQQCVMQTVKTQVAITFTLPKWTTVRRAERSLLADWQRYMAALQLHEDGHKNHGVEAGHDIQQALSQLPPATSCADLERHVQTTARAIIQRYNQKDLDYDRVTRHGYTQGAVFPTTTTVSR